MHLRNEVIARYRTIAVVGLSARANRPSYVVAAYMQSHGYRVIPINPTLAGQIILGEVVYASLADAEAVLAKENIDIEIVDCFRKSEEMGAIADEAIAIGANCLWMQIGVINAVAAAGAEKAGLIVVMNH